MNKQGSCFQPGLARCVGEVCLNHSTEAIRLQINTESAHRENNAEPK